jgi:hypothetical protein
MKKFQNNFSSSSNAVGFASSIVFKIIEKAEWNIRSRDLEKLI